MLIRVPILTSVFGDGVWRMTCRLEGLLVGPVTLPGAHPANSICRFAMATVWPFSFGTVHVVTSAVQTRLRSAAEKSALIVNKLRSRAYADRFRNASVA
jgi:hypothetical protein